MIRLVVLFFVLESSTWAIKITSKEEIAVAASEPCGVKGVYDLVPELPCDKGRERIANGGRTSAKKKAIISTVVFFLALIIWDTIRMQRICYGKDETL